MNNIDNIIQDTFGSDACFYYSDTVYSGQNYWCSLATRDLFVSSQYEGVSGSFSW